MKYFIKWGIGILAACFAGFVLISQSVSANVTIFLPSITLSGSIATSTLNQIGPGTGTSTLIYDSYSTGQPFVTNNAIVLIQDTASTSSSVLKITPTYSQNGLDWYSDTTDLPATTTPPFNLGAAYSWSYTAPATASTTNISFSFSIPVRYVKFTFTGTGATSSIFAQITPRRESVAQ